MYSDKNVSIRDGQLKMSHALAMTNLESIGKKWDSAILIGGTKCIHTTNSLDYSCMKRAKT